MGFCRRATPACKTPQKKFLFPPRKARGKEDREQELILNLQQLPGNLVFFSQWLNSYYVSRDCDSSRFTDLYFPRRRYDL